MKIVVIGAGGMLGHQIVRKLSGRFPGDVFGFVRKDPAAYSKFSFANNVTLVGNVDVNNHEHLLQKLNEIRPQWVINCVGLTLRKQELGVFEKCIEINSMLPHRLSLWAEQNASKVIHFSTDCVFDGAKGNYRESDQPSAGDLYGKSKFLGETKSASALTMRLSIVGRELEAKTELVEWFLSQKGQTVKGYTQAMYSGLTTNRVASEVLNIIGKFPQLSGLYQIASEPISKFDLLNLLNKHFDARAEILPYEAYKVDKTLNCERYMKATGFVPPRWEDMIQEMAQDTSADYGD